MNFSILARWALLGLQPFSEGSRIRLLGFAGFTESIPLKLLVYDFLLKEYSVGFALFLEKIPVLGCSFFTSNWEKSKKRKNE